MKNNFIRLTLLSTTSFLIFFILLEVMIRFLMPSSDTQLRHDRSETFYKPDPNLMHPFVKDPIDAMSIHVFGDSFTEGAGVMEIDAFPKKLEYLLNMNSNSKGVIVHNRGRSGTSTYQRIRHLENTMDQQPDIVILQITLNDTEDWDDPDTIREWRDNILVKPAEGIVAWFTNYSHCARLLYSKFAVIRSKRGFMEYYENLYNIEYSGWKKFRAAIADFGRIAHASNVKLVAVLFPLFSHNLNDTLYPFHAYHEQVRYELATHDIPYLDLSETFEGLSHERLQVIPNIDPHPNEIAHRLAAEQLMRFLISEKLVPETNLPRNAAQTEIHERWATTHSRMKP